MTKRLVCVLVWGVICILALIQPVTGADDESGAGFPKFKLENLKGDTVSSDDAFANADLILIDFFTYYCKPCKKLMPYVSGFQDKYGEHGFKAILFDEDEPEGIPLSRSYVKQNEYSFEVLFDVERAVESFYSITKQPTTILLNSAGEVVHRHEGYNKGDEKALEEFIRGYLEDIGNLEEEG